MEELERALERRLTRFSYPHAENEGRKTVKKVGKISFRTNFLRKPAKTNENQ